MTILALETSCDETAVAILRGSELLASEVASQTAEHEKFGGVVPEVASRNHLVHAPRLLERVARQAKVEISQIDAFAATSGPGLASSLMIGASIAKGLAIGFGKPYLAINHLEGHLLSPFFGEAKIKANVSLVVSGGVSCNRELRKQLGEACKRYSFEFKTAEPWLCTDNAAMIAFAAMLKLKNNVSSSVTQEIDPNLALAI